MNWCLKSGGQTYSPHRRIYIEIFHFVSWFATKYLSHVREYFLKMWIVGSRHVEVVRPHCVVTVHGFWVFRHERYESPRTLWTFANTKNPGSFLLRRVSSYSHPVLHLFGALENSTLRHFDLTLSLLVSPNSWRIKQCWLGALSTMDGLMHLDSATCFTLRNQV